MTSPETNEKKIETLTKIARLLSDQLKEQNTKLALLQKEVAAIKITIDQGLPLKSASQVASSSLNDESVSHTDSTPHDEKASPSTITATDLPVEKDSEKKELLEALKIIDNL
ncbi:MAG: hypothetical protein ACFFE8_08185 [Candidatus Heimdallarchaeota archaeon]